MSLPVKASSVQVKLEVTEGTDPGSWATTDLLACSALSEGLGIDQQPINEYGGSLDGGETIAGAPKPTVTIRGPLRGSGNVTTPIPAFSALMKMAMFLETAQTVLPSTLTVTATSGTADTITFLGTSGGGLDFPSTALLGQALIGCAVELAGNPSTPTVATIIDYTVSAGNRTIQVSRNATECGAGAVFTVATTIKVLPGIMWTAGSPDPQPSGFVRQFRGGGTGGVMQSYAGARSSARFTIHSGSFAEFEFAVGGQLVGRAATNSPGTASFLSPPIGVNGACHFTGGALNASKLEMQELSCDTGSTGQYPDDINALTGVQAYIIGARNITGSVNPLLVKPGVRNIVTEILAQTRGKISSLVGPKTGYGATNTGNRFMFTLPVCKVLDAPMTEDNVVLRETYALASASFDGGLKVYMF